MRILSFIIFLLTSCMAFGQVAPGSWRHIASFGRPEGVALTGDHAYMLSGGSLFAVSLDEGNLRYCASDPGLSGSEVTVIRSNPAGSCVMAGMADGGIDILFDNGSTVTMRDVADAALAGSRSINDAAFSPDGYLYVATDFGLVRYNPDRGVVADYGIYGGKVDAVAAGGAHIYISMGDSLLVAPIDASIRTLDSFALAGPWASTAELQAVGSDMLLARHSDGIGFYRVGQQVEQLRWVGGHDASPFSASADKVYTSCDGVLWVVSADGMIRAGELSEQLKSGIVATRSGVFDVWGLDAAGIIRMQRPEDGQWTTTMQRLRPQAIAGTDAMWITPSADASVMLFSNLGSSIFRITDEQLGGGNNVRLNVTRLDSDGFHDVSPDHAFRSPMRVVADPDDPTRYFATSGVDGMISVKDGVVEGYYNSRNAPVDDTWGCRIMDVTVDAMGNLWIVAFTSVTNGGVLVLPAEKRRLAPDEVVKSDWVVLPMGDVNLRLDSRVIHCPGSNVALMFDEGGQQLLAAYDHAGNPLDPSAHRILAHQSFIDQDQRVFSPQFITSADVAPDGSVWLGTPSGIIEIASPEQALDPSMVVRRLKVGHDDGTGLADYLLESDVVMDIASDGAGRRWIATKQSGVMLLSPRGDEILKHFTEADSPLPSDEVRAVRPSATGNSVYIITAAGAMEYGSDASDPAEKLASLHVYPNPVTPTSPGPVTIEGLTDGALVKITDARGAVVFETRAQGGMATWNLENFSGHYVSSGVYFILASPRSGESGSATAKIMVIN